MKVNGCYHLFPNLMRLYGGGGTAVLAWLQLSVLWHLCNYVYPDDGGSMFHRNVSAFLLH